MLFSFYVKEGQNSNAKHTFFYFEESQFNDYSLVTFYMTKLYYSEWLVLNTFVPHRTWNSRWKCMYTTFYPVFFFQIIPFKNKISQMDQWTFLLCRNCKL